MNKRQRKKQLLNTQTDLILSMHAARTELRGKNPITRRKAKQIVKRIVRATREAEQRAEQLMIERNQAIVRRHIGKIAFRMFNRSLENVIRRNYGR